MSSVYQVTSRGVSPLVLAKLKDYVKVDQDIVADDEILQRIIDSCTSWGERYTSRDFRANTYQLLLDELCDRVTINKDPVDSITSVEHIVDDVFVAIDNTIYYLKKGVFDSEILLKSGKSWPTDTDEREQAFRITFVTKAYDAPDLILDALARHCIASYMNRGDSFDFESVTHIGEMAKQSGAVSIYNRFRIPRV